VFDFSLAALFAPVLGWLAVYWPALLVVWGGFKIYQRATHPQTARVSGLEVFLLFVIVVLGLGVRAARHVAMRLELDDISVIEETFALAPPHRFVEERVFELSQETTTLTVITDRGAIRARGWDEPRVQAVVSKYVRHATEARAEEIARNLEVSLHTTDELAELNLTPPRDTDRDTDTSTDMEVELDLLIPKRVALVVKNRRGPVRVSELAARVDVATSHDNVEIESVSGDVEVSTRHESIRLDGIQGSVSATNHHGPITATRVGGNLTAETLNGAIRLEEIGGAAELRTRHGSIRVHRIEGELTIDGLNSEIDVEDAASRVSVETSNHVVFIRDVKGELDVEARNSAVTLRNLHGAARLRNRYGPVTVLSAGGSVGIEAPQSAVVIDRVSGDVNIRSSHERVTISNVDGTVVVEAEHAPVHVTNRGAPGDLRLHTSYGDVELEIPFAPDGRYELRTRSGELHSGWVDVDWKASDTSDGKSWIHAPEIEGGPVRSVEVVTSYGNIVLKEP
jgi:DUF4097 and DUF4098 domain-containing protein YvlB